MRFNLNKTNKVPVSKSQEIREKKVKKVVKASKGKTLGAKTPLGNLRQKLIEDCPRCNGNPLEKTCKLGDMEITYCDEMNCMEVIRWEKL